MARPCGSQRPASDRVTYLSKLEIFNERGTLKLPRTVCVEDLEHMSFYAFWRLFDVASNRLSKRQREKITAVQGLGWPSHASRTHALHDGYARKTLYA